jgi:hypothetical protein
MDTDFTADIDAIQRIDAVPRILEIVCRSTGIGFAAVARVTDGRWICFAVRDEIEFGFTGRRVSRRNDDLSRNSTKPSSGRYRSCCRRRIFLWAPHTGPIRLCFFRSGNGDLARDVSAASPRGRMSAQMRTTMLSVAAHIGQAKVRNSKPGLSCSRSERIIGASQSAQNGRSLVALPWKNEGI